MISFHPDSIQYNQNIPPVVLTDIKINNESISPGDHSILEKCIGYTNEIDLSYNQNNLSFEFASLNYISPYLNQYKYKLEGYHSEWIFSGNRSFAEFTNLDPGKFTFRVAGSNNDGVWNEEGASLQIIIRPPPWQTWYAYLVYGLLLAGILLWYRRFLKNKAELRLAARVEKVEKEKVLEMDQLKSRFFTNISHEFRTPLTLILGPLENLDSKKSGNISFSRDLVSAMRRNARRLLRLINQLLDISKLEMGKMSIQASEGDLEGFVRTIVLSFLSLAESKKIEYTYELPETSGEHFFDPDKLEKILTNLISNAFKYTPEEGEVRIQMNYFQQTDSEQSNSKVSGHGTYAEVIIRDSGKGIPADRLDRIFDRFYQASDPDTLEEEGTGIGLALTKELVDLYRGQISVESEPGRGSTFTLRIPVSRELFQENEIVEQVRDQVSEPYREIADPYEKGYKESKVSKTGSHLKGAPVILIVEDNADMRNYISDILGINYQIRMAENGKNGLDLAISHIPELIISDVMMPVMNGIDMCRQLKKDERTNHIPVIMLTAKADQDSKIEGLDTGADDYLIKPFDGEEMRVRVRNLIDQRRKLREKFRHEFISQTDEGSIDSPRDLLTQKILDIFRKHIEEADFSIEEMCDELNLSRTQLFNIVSSLTGYTPMSLLRTIRLKKAAILFDRGHKNVTQVMYQVGFNNHSYFARSFREVHKLNPSEYIRKAL